MAGAMGLQDTDTLALLTQVNRRRQTGDTGTDHTDVDTQLTLEKRGASGRCGVSCSHRHASRNAIARLRK